MISTCIMTGLSYGLLALAATVTFALGAIILAPIIVWIAAFIGTITRIRGEVNE